MTIRKKTLTKTKSRKLLTALEFSVLSLLRSGPQYAETLQKYLKQNKISHSSAAFYQLMTRLNQSHWITRKSVKNPGNPHTSTLYTITTSGFQAWTRTLQFYLNHAGTPGNTNKKETRT